MSKFLIVSELLVSAALGAAGAALFNLAIAGERSLLERAARSIEWMTETLGGAPGEPWVFILALAVLMSVGGLSVLYARPLGRKGALACGVCAVAVLALLAP